MAEALQLVKDAYGSDGVILHTRTYKQGGILGFGARNIVEVTAGRGQDIGRQRRRSAEKSPRAVALANAAERRRKLQAEQQKKQQKLEHVHGTAGDLIKKTYAAARAQLETTQTATLPATANEAAVAQHAAAAITGTSGIANSGASNISGGVVSSNVSGGVVSGRVLGARSSHVGGANVVGASRVNGGIDGGNQNNAASIAAGTRPSRLTSNDIPQINRPVSQPTAPVQPTAEPQVVYAQPMAGGHGGGKGGDQGGMGDWLTN